jgi:serine/threonine protein kinase
MGTVWLALQTEPVKRLVALKLIKAGMDSRQVIARFEAERQALALMDHPNIARVLDAGTASSGRPYFVMDLVKGAPITKYCDEHYLTPGNGWSCSSPSVRQSSTLIRRESSIAISSRPMCWSLSMMASLYQR